MQRSARANDRAGLARDRLATSDLEALEAEFREGGGDDIEALAAGLSLGAASGAKPKGLVRDRLSTQELDGWAQELGVESSGSPPGTRPPQAPLAPLPDESGESETDSSSASRPPTAQHEHSLSLSDPPGTPLASSASSQPPVSSFADESASPSTLTPTRTGGEALRQHLARQRLLDEKPVGSA